MFDHIYRDDEYDVEVNTAKLSPEEYAERVLRGLEMTRKIGDAPPLSQEVQ
ncbi:hypothetical protein [Haladaptatus sp. DFWS20]|uniref:hypothetical protein n=1 Tax=Haladaptatus sp. DFWS20 TaxID=3403467 RepID=UPI003EB8C5D4